MGSNYHIFPMNKQIKGYSNKIFDRQGVITVTKCQVNIINTNLLKGVLKLYLYTINSNEHLLYN